MTIAANGGPVEASELVLLVPGEHVVPSSILVDTRDDFAMVRQAVRRAEPVQGFDFLVDDRGAVELPETD